MNKKIKILSQKSRINNDTFHLVLVRLRSLYLEINNYNNNYWSKFIFSLLTTYTSFICLALYQIIYSIIPFVTLVMYLYGISFLIVKLVFFVSTASSIVYSSNLTYQLLNHLIIKKHKERIFSTIYLIKVSFESIFT